MQNQVMREEISGGGNGMSEIQMIPIAQLVPHPDNPRKEIGDIGELTESIKKNGILQNLTVVHMLDGTYRVIIGHRRMAAAKAAGLEELPCTVARMDERQQLCTMMEENMQRKDLTIPEQAYGFQYMLDLGESVSSIAQKTGFSEQTVKHRLEIAKLNKKTLHNAVMNEAWQISIKDLMMLEKVKDIKKRNQILKDSAGGYSSFCNAISIALREQNRISKKEKWQPLLDKAGVQPAPKNVNSWTPGYKTVKRIDLDDKKEPKSLRMEGYDKNKPILLVENYGWMYLLQKEDEKKEELSEWQIEQKRKEKIQKEVKKKLEAALKEMRQLARDLYSGARELENMDPEQELGYIRALWELFQDNKSFMGYQSVVVLSDKKNRWDVSCGEKDEYVEKLRKLPISTQMVVYLSDGWTADQVETMRYGLKYRKENGEKLCRVFDVLNKLYGFTFSDNEFIEIIEGTHELYEKEDA